MLAKAQVAATKEQSATVVVLVGEHKGKVYRMPPRTNLTPDQFVDITIFNDGINASWPE